MPSGNHATMDGSVRWIVAGEFLSAPAYTMSGPTQLYFKGNP